MELSADAECFQHSLVFNISNETGEYNIAEMSLVCQDHATLQVKIGGAQYKLIENKNKCWKKPPTFLL